jgi:hypothetical protein
LLLPMPDFASILPTIWTTSNMVGDNGCQ